MKTFGIISFFFIFVFQSSFGQNYNLLKDAKDIGNDCYRLTTATGYQTGVVWYQDKLNLNEQFNIEFLMNFGSNDANGADGMMFIMQTVGNQAIGQTGGGLGFAGFSPSLGIEFDTWSNKSEFASSGDIDSDHIAILQNGNVFHLTPDNLAGPTQASAVNTNIEDGKDHVVRIIWDPKNNLIEVFFDCVLRISLKKNIIQEVFKGKAEVWWGFGGATGGGVNNQTVCLKKEILFKNEIKSICPNQSVQLISRVALDNIYNWTPTNGLNNSNSRTPIATPQKTTTYTVKYRNYCGIEVSDTIRVEVTPLPEIDFKGDKELCNGKIIDIVPVLTPNNLPITFKWSTGETSPKISVNQLGSYELLIQNGACTTKATTNVIAGKLPILKPDENLCLNQTTLQLESGATLPNLSYFWTPTNSTNSTLNISQTGKYQVRVTTQAGCEATRTINVLDAPKVDLGIDQTICEGNILELIPTVIGTGPFSYKWSSGETTKNLKPNKTGKYILTITEQSCSVSDSMQLVINPLPKISPNETTCKDKPLIAGIFDNNLFYLWEHSGENTREVTVQNEGIYKVKISNQAGCSAIKTFTVLAQCDTQIFSPNAFSPNKDGINDFFEVLISGGIVTSFEIYNRWGDLIYTDTIPQWDGKDCLPGIYAYILKYRTLIDDSELQYYGVITLIR